MAVSPIDLSSPMNAYLGVGAVTSAIALQLGKTKEPSQPRDSRRTLATSYEGRQEGEMEQSHPGRGLDLWVHDL